MALSDRQTRAEVAQTSQMFMKPEHFNILRNLYHLILTMIGWLSVSVEVFLRRDFGERYLNLLRLFMGWSIMRGVIFLLTLVTVSLPAYVNSMIPFGGTRYGPPPPIVSNWFVMGFLLLGAVHLARIWQRSYQGTTWHSQSFGISWFSFLPVSDWVLYRWVEPALALLLGLRIQGIDPVTGNWIILASIALFVRNNLAYNDLRGVVLDRIDAQIEATFFYQASEQRPKQETAGFSVIPVPQGDLFRSAEDPPDIAATVQETMGERAGEAIEGSAPPPATAERGRINDSIAEELQSVQSAPEEGA